jgi:hypothetical protein
MWYRPLLNLLEGVTPWLLHQENKDLHFFHAPGDLGTKLIQSFRFRCGETEMMPDISWWHQGHQVQIIFRQYWIFPVEKPGIKWHEFYRARAGKPGKQSDL